MSQETTINRLRRSLDQAKQALQNPTLKGHVRRDLVRRRDKLAQELDVLTGRTRATV